MAWKPGKIIKGLKGQQVRFIPDKIVKTYYDIGKIIYVEEDKKAVMHHFTTNENYELENIEGVTLLDITIEQIDIDSSELAKVAKDLDVKNTLFDAFMKFPATVELRETYRGLRYLLVRG